jgi:hypothetical protein
MASNDSSDPNVQRRILEDVVTAIREGRAPPGLERGLDTFEELLAWSEQGKDTDSLAKLASGQREMISSAAMVTVQKALEFLTGEITRLKTITAERPLTEEEDRFVKESLITLVNSTKSLLLDLQDRHEAWGDGEEDLE